MSIYLGILFNNYDRIKREEAIMKFGMRRPS